LTRAGDFGLRVRAGAARLFLVAMGLLLLRRACVSCAAMPLALGIAFGGALGALARYGLDEWIGRRTGAFPWGILVVNVTGAFLIGVAVEALEPRFEEGWVRAAVVTGFLGAYTTFSTLSLDTYRLLDRGELDQALLNSVGALALGLVAVWMGLRVGRAL